MSLPPRDDERRAREARQGTPPLVRLADVAVGYGRGAVLSGVSLSVERGTVTALVGENGSGKTTLLRALLGLLRPRSGEVLWPQGRPRLGYVPQVDVSEVLFPVTAEEVVLMGLVPRLGPLRRPGAEHRQRCRAALRRLRVEALASRPFRALSGGQRQRVLLARGIVSDPDLLALDEPVRGLDFASSEQLVALIHDLAERERMAVVVATHSLELVVNHSHFVALFGNGQVEWGPVEQILTDERLSRYHGHPIRVRSVEGRRVVLPGAGPGEAP